MLESFPAIGILVSINVPFTTGLLLTTPFAPLGTLLVVLTSAPTGAFTWIRKPDGPVMVPFAMAMMCLNRGPPPRMVLQMVQVAFMPRMMVLVETGRVLSPIR